ncbi:MAG: TetR family transcriptional regulator, partial [Microbacteriaceae bacterium]
GAVQTLASENTEALNVSDIVRVAKISRSTFYAHFSDIDELAVAFLHATFTAPGAPVADLRIAGEASDQTARRGYRLLVAHIVDHYSVYQSTLTLQPMRKAYDDAVAAYGRSLVRTIAETVEIPDGVRLDAVAAYAAGGAIALIREWLDGSISLSDDEIVEQLVALLPHWLLPPSA